jgi:ribulose-phosphate 3-epimerase
LSDFLIAPSILSADLTRLGQEVEEVMAAGADLIHFDVMDNHYVPNLTFGPLVCSALRRVNPNLLIDVHLMVKPVDRLIDQFIDAGASYISFHPDATNHVDLCLQKIKAGGCKAGLAFNPATPLTYLDHVLDKLDMVLIMSVNPGWGGQTFIHSSYEKISQVRERITASGCSIRLAVDGGVNQQNIARVAQAGADFFVAGSAIFAADSYQQSIMAIRQALK